MTLMNLLGISLDTVAPDRALAGLYDDLFGLYTRAIAANAELNADLLALAMRAPRLSENCT